jgi:two-component system, NtrC family, sensor kinase
MLTVCQLEKKDTGCGEELYRSIASSARVAIVVMDDSGRIIFWNPAAREVFGYGESEVLGRDAYALLVPEPCQQVYAETLERLRRIGAGSSTGETIELCGRRKNGVEFPIELSMSIMGEGNGRHVIAVVRDITDRTKVEKELASHQEMLEEEVHERSEKLLEAQRQVLQGEKLASVGRLAAGIAHEINTPIQYVGDNLHAIAQFLQDLRRVLDAYREGMDQAAKAGVAPETVEKAKAAEREHDLDFVLEDAPKAVAQALEGVQRVAQIVRAMKDFSHIKGGASSSIDINHCLESTLTVARNEYKYHADVKTDLGPLPLISCYPSELNQVFLNLLINATHAIQDTGQRGLITVTTRADGEWVEVSIADTGGGIPEDIRDKIYEPFFTTKEVGKGTGQGLYIARQIIVGKHGGTLTFDSEIGKGTTFRIRIPIKLASSEGGAEGTENGQDSNPVC